MSRSPTSTICGCLLQRAFWNCIWLARTLEIQPRSTSRSPPITSWRPVALLTPADRYPLALFQSKVATKTTAAMVRMPKTQPIQIKARRFPLVIRTSSLLGLWNVMAQKTYHRFLERIPKAQIQETRRFRSDLYQSKDFKEFPPMILQAAN